MALTCWSPPATLLLLTALVVTILLAVEETHSDESQRERAVKPVQRQGEEASREEGRIVEEGKGPRDAGNDVDRNDARPPFQIRRLSPPALTSSLLPIRVYPHRRSDMSDPESVVDSDDHSNFRATAQKTWYIAGKVLSQPQSYKFIHSIITILNLTGRRRTYSIPKHHDAPSNVVIVAVVAVVNLMPTSSPAAKRPQTCSPPSPTPRPHPSPTSRCSTAARSRASWTAPPSNCTPSRSASSPPDSR